MKRIWQVSTSLNDKRKTSPVDWVFYFLFSFCSCLFLFVFVPFYIKTVLYSAPRCQERFVPKLTVWAHTFQSRSEAVVRIFSPHRQKILPWDVTQRCQTPRLQSFCCTLRLLRPTRTHRFINVYTSIHHVFGTPRQLEVFYFVSNHFKRRCSTQNTDLIKH